MPSCSIGNWSRRNSRATEARGGTAMEVAAEEKLGRVYDLKLLRWVWSYVHPYRKLFFFSVLLMPLNSLFALAQPFIWKLTIDLFLTHSRSAPPRWLEPVLALFGNHGLLAMGF